MTHENFLNTYRCAFQVGSQKTERSHFAIMISLLTRTIFHFLLFTNTIYGYTPVGRYGHSATLIGTKIYFFGGLINDQNISPELFYLDLSKNISTADLNYVSTDFSIPDGIQGVFSAAVSAGITTSTTIFGYGGETNVGSIIRDPFQSPNNTFFSIDTRNSSSPSISISRQSTNGPGSRMNLNTVIDTNGYMYIFGGYDGVFKDRSMYILDTRNLTWSIILRPNAPDFLWGYTSTLLKDGRILYIGGNRVATENNPNRGTDMNIIQAFNTLNSQWSQLVATSDEIIPSRSGHTAILSSDGNKIIIYGGSLNQTSSNGGIAALDIPSFQWSLPSNQNLGPSAIPNQHTAVLFNDYMIIAFVSMGFRSSGKRNDTSSGDLNILDIANGNYQWVDFTDRPLPSSQSKTTLENSSNSSTTEENSSSESFNSAPSHNNGLPIWSIVVMTILAFIVFLVAFFGIRKYFLTRPHITDQPTTSHISSTSHIPSVFSVEGSPKLLRDSNEVVDNQVYVNRLTRYIWDIRIPRQKDIVRVINTVFQWTAIFLVMNDDFLLKKPGR
ncbi:hypothetical protein G9A89_008950 [Geosiphon pyriformis]|nr:hypothetical protein G9A89_008950 [Geosiphon pyriformis]